MRQSYELQGDLHRPPHGLCAQRLAFGQGVLCQRLAGTFHPAVCRYSAHAFHCCGGRAAARRPSRRGTRRGVFLRLGLARWRRFGRTGGGSRLRARPQAQAEETPQGTGIIIQSFTPKNRNRLCHNRKTI